MQLGRQVSPKMQPQSRRAAPVAASSRRAPVLLVRAVLQQQRGTDVSTTQAEPNTQTQPSSAAPPARAPPAPLPFRVGYKAEKGLRPRQEDELDVEVDRDNGYVFAGVYDGHGGTAAAKWLKAELYDRIKRELQSHAQGLTHDNPQVPSGLDMAFKAIDQTLLAHLEAQGGEELAQSGSTATVVMVWPDRVVAANVGDSGAYIWRSNQQMVQLTTPHRVYGGGPEMDKEVQRIKSVGGWVYDGRVCNVLAVSRAFGDWEFKGRGLARLLPRGIERGYWDQAFADTIKFTGDPIIVTPESRDVAITPADEFMVVATDGLFDVFPAREAMQWARKELQRGYTPQEVSERLVDMAMKRYTTDNTSVVVIDLKGEQYWHEMASKPRGPGAFLSGLFGR